VRRSLGMSLSGGERRRVEIARALAANPRFLLLDEPFAGVDPISVIDIQRIVRELSARNIGVLITDHNVRETLGVCQRSYIIGDGVVIASGSAEEILANPRVREVYLGESFRL
jgi:lipopolysaccharide export system ATP-binding protein